ncbi:UPF0041-domain-containing protein [Polychaeton citri CBS 116435]|uniref:Mitochondrial pyruvate carrier n=1 Tax=Polychaeton citri CBS 116435 TaxID=1314669 RepID=A0A9P4QC18_9PEZI|nr:UPF0041-domain-containing protein [Polychaeton citri CBS 116435]
MPSRIGLRAFQSLRQSFAANQTQTAFRFAQRRGAQTAAENAAPAAPAPEQSAFAKLWNSPVGPKTVHFWAPIMKWGVTLAGAADFARPASQLSITQSAALMATGAIWTRWCFVIKPRNIFLASVNFVLFCVSSIQVGRVLVYRSSQKDAQGVEGAAGELAQKEGKVLEKVAADPIGAAKNAVGK